MLLQFKQAFGRGAYKHITQYVLAQNHDRHDHQLQDGLPMLNIFAKIEDRQEIVCLFTLFHA
jgi:hypothetical protein